MTPVLGEDGALRWGYALPAGGGLIFLGHSETPRPAGAGPGHTPASAAAPQLPGLPSAPPQNGAALTGTNNLPRRPEISREGGGRSLLPHPLHSTLARSPRAAGNDCCGRAAPPAVKAAPPSVPPSSGTAHFRRRRGGRAQGGASPSPPPPPPLRPGPAPGMVLDAGAGP